LGSRTGAELEGRRPDHPLDGVRVQCEATRDLGGRQPARDEIQDLSLASCERAATARAGRGAADSEQPQGAVHAIQEQDVPVPRDFAEFSTTTNGGTT
jgi:hypothetical protein